MPTTQKILHVINVSPNIGYKTIMHVKLSFGFFCLNLENKVHLVAPTDNGIRLATKIQLIRLECMVRVLNKFQCFKITTKVLHSTADARAAIVEHHVVTTFYKTALCPTCCRQTTSSSYFCCFTEHSNPSAEFQMNLINGGTRSFRGIQ